MARGTMPVSPPGSDSNTLRMAAIRSSATRRYTVGREVIDVLKDEEVPEGYEGIYTKYITLRNGKRLYASTYGRKVWRLVIRKKK